MPLNKKATPKQYAFIIWDKTYISRKRYDVQLNLLKIYKLYNQ